MTTSSYAHLVAADTVRIERTLPGPIERVWAFLTEPDKRGQMAGDRRDGAARRRIASNTCSAIPNSPKTTIHRRRSTRNTAAESRMHGRITACKPPRLLAYTWGEPSGEHSQVRFQLIEDGD